MVEIRKQGKGGRVEGISGWMGGLVGVIELELREEGALTLSVGTTD